MRVTVLACRVPHFDFVLNIGSHTCGCTFDLPTVCHALHVVHRICHAGVYIEYVTRCTWCIEYVTRCTWCIEYVTRCTWYIEYVTPACMSDMSRVARTWLVSLLSGSYFRLTSVLPTDNQTHAVPTPACCTVAHFVAALALTLAGLAMWA